MQREISVRIARREVRARCEEDAKEFCVPSPCRFDDRGEGEPGLVPSPSVSFESAPAASRSLTMQKRPRRDASRESCHVNGQFAGTPFQCLSCHGGLGARAETRRSTWHIPIQSDYNDCRTTRFWEPARMDHGTVGEDCESCHVGRMATNRPPGHIESSNQCGDCHGTGCWGGRFDHAAALPGIPAGLRRLSRERLRGRWSASNGHGQ